MNADMSGVSPWCFWQGVIHPSVLFMVMLCASATHSHASDHMMLGTFDLSITIIECFLTHLTALISVGFCCRWQGSVNWSPMIRRLFILFTAFDFWVFTLSWRRTVRAPSSQRKSEQVSGNSDLVCIGHTLIMCEVSPQHQTCVHVFLEELFTCGLAF